MRLTRPAFLSLAAFGLLLFATRAWLIGQYGNPTPFWDQWDAEAAWIYIPWLEGSLKWEYLVMPHNEHRILMTRLLALALLEANGLWNPQLQMLVNAWLHSTAIGLAAWLACRSQRSDTLAPVLLASLLLFGMPYAWENILGGFQAQFFLLLLFGTAALWFAATAPTFGALWWLAAMLALGSYFCMASGALTFIALAAVAMSRLLLGKEGNPREAFAAVLLTALFAACYFAIPVIDEHRAFRASDLAGFYKAAVSALSWPLSANIGNALVRNAPGLLLIGLMARNRRLDPAHLFLLGLLAWSIAQSVAAAFGRATTPRVPRLLDLYAWAAFANLLCVAAMLSQAGVRQRGAVLGAGGWVVVILGAVVLRAQPVSAELAQKREHGRVQQENTRAYVLTGDMSHLRGRDIPYPDPERLARLLDRPSLREILPTSLRAPLDGTLDATPADAFVPNGVFPSTPDSHGVAWGSYTERGGAQGGAARLRFDLPARAAGAIIGVAGYPAHDGMRLEVIRNGRAHALSLVRSPGENWHWVDVKATGGRIELVLTDHSAATWMAVGGVRVRGRLDGAVGWLVRHPEWPGYLAILLALVLLWRRPGGTDASSPS